MTAQLSKTFNGTVRGVPQLAPGESFKLAHSRVAPKGCALGRTILASVTLAFYANALPKATLILEFPADKAISTAANTRRCLLGHTLDDRSS